MPNRTRSVLLRAQRLATSTAARCGRPRRRRRFSRSWPYGMSSSSCTAIDPLRRHLVELGQRGDRPARTGSCRSAASPGPASGAAEPEPALGHLGVRPLVPAELRARPASASRSATMKPDVVPVAGVLRARVTQADHQPGRVASCSTPRQQSGESCRSAAFAVISAWRCWRAADASVLGGLALGGLALGLGRPRRSRPRAARRSAPALTTASTRSGSTASSAPVGQLRRRRR